MQQLHTTPIAKNDLTNFLVRLGKIFSNISIFTLIMCLSGILSFVALAFIMILGLCIIILSVGTIFVIVPNYFNILLSATKISATIASFFLKNFYIFATITIIGSIAAIVLLNLDKRTKHTGRIVISSIVLVILIISIVVFLLGGK